MVLGAHQQGGGVGLASKSQDLSIYWMFWTDKSDPQRSQIAGPQGSVVEILGWKMVSQYLKVRTLEFFSRPYVRAWYLELVIMYVIGCVFRA